jgi:hypothetical protein
VRAERYGREEVLRAYNDLHPKGGPQEAAVQPRLERVKDVLPRNEPK